MRSLAIILLFALPSSLFSQSKWMKYIPTTFDVGFLQSIAKGDSSTSWTNTRSNNLHVRCGYGLLYNKRFGMQTEGGILINQYSFISSYAAYSVAHINLSANVTPYILIPFPKKPNGYFNIGCGTGFTFRKNETLNKQVGGYKVNSVSYKGAPFTLAPELGVSTIEKRLSFCLLLTYNFQVSSDYAIKTTIADDKGMLESKSRGDYVGLKFRFMLKLQNKELPKNYKHKPEEHDEYMTRPNPVIRSFKTKKDYVTLEFYENNKVDHDSISVTINGHYILVNHGLTKEKVTLQVPLEKGINTITVYALNEGDIPPNTATCMVKFGRKKEEFMVQTGKKKNASIEIEVK